MGSSGFHGSSASTAGRKADLHLRKQMNCDTAGYKQAPYDDAANEMKNILVKVGWKKDLVEKTRQLCRSLVR